MKPLVGVIMGSTSDWETMKHACDILEELNIPYEKQVVSAHRTPDLMFEYATEARGKGLKVIIAGAGGAAHYRGWSQQNDTAGHWCARTIKSIKRARFLIIHRSNARRCTCCHSGNRQSWCNKCRPLAAQMISAFDEAVAARLEERREQTKQTVLESSDQLG